MELRALDEGEDALGHALVVERVLDRVGQRGLANVRRELEVDEHRLPDLPLPIVDADDRLGLERVNEYLVHERFDYSPCDPSSQLALAPSRAPDGPHGARRMHPASAIIAPLSVQNSARGK